MTTGAIVWYELLSTDPKGSLAFYPDVVGWKTEAWGNQDYTMFVGSQGALGGVARLPEEAQKMGAPTYWQANIQVASLDAAVEKVKELGGNVIVSEAVPTVGRFAVITDPQGAVVALFQPDKEMPAHDIRKAGEFSWHELYTTDHEAAFAFYSQIAGWERLGSFDMGPMGTYLLWGRGGKQLGGMMNKPPSMPQPGWLFYITTPDLDDALARAKARGAKLLNGPMEVPGGQRVVQMVDPQGGAFAMVTPPNP
jgi:predicted enzyme related to lactoylglutathione lyase